MFGFGTLVRRKGPWLDRGLRTAVSTSGSIKGEAVQPGPGACIQQSQQLHTGLAERATAGVRVVCSSQWVSCWRFEDGYASCGAPQCSSTLGVGRGGGAGRDRQRLGGGGSGSGGIGVAGADRWMPTVPTATGRVEAVPGEEHTESLWRNMPLWKRPHATQRRRQTYRAAAIRQPQGGARSLDVRLSSRRYPLCTCIHLAHLHPSLTHPRIPPAWPQVCLAPPPSPTCARRAASSSAPAAAGRAAASRCKPLSGQLLQVLELLLLRLWRADAASAAAAEHVAAGGRSVRLPAAAAAGGVPPGAGAGGVAGGCGWSRGPCGVVFVTQRWTGASLWPHSGVH